MQNSDINALKKEFRRKVKECKLQLSEEDKILKSKKVFAQLSDMEIFKKAKIVMMYWSMSDELQTHEAVLNFAKTKKIILPVVQGDVLELRLFNGIENMESGASFGIGEPVGKAFTDYQSIDIIIVPGVAFDKKNNRLGRGKAFYDKLLKETTALKIGLCFDVQLFDEVPYDELDVKMDMVLCG
ncbi:MAG: 5-formyltetrahydrofolate cyclo-ligase [Bacteroidetes bacterium HGW-Bacteroidetes-21]|jgi:5-formyltetrahydrofolate cyclo-ligase|nr:MAG: 5-formyltetrahydrofolate cyclo-ligase [Bacteroidetes bacterium HGW-Bacteroidetes-21]